MKLRNKKTGEIIGFKIIADYDDCTSGWRLEKQDGSVLFYDHIDEIREEWEDYKPAEPLIKDEKIRKAVRAWAEAVGTECVEITHSRSHFIRFMSYLADEDELCMSREIGQIFDEKLYTIAELCGEVEE